MRPNNTDIHPKDLIIQSHFPTVMVPKHSPLVPCEVRRTRLLMARDGLYIEAVQPWGRLVHRLWVSPRPLPYGAVEEDNEFTHILGMCHSLLLESQIRAAAYASKNKEWAGWIITDENGPYGYRLIEPDFEASATHARITYPELKPGSSLVIDIHSHGRAEPFFSSTDNEDDKGGVRICVVIGYSGKTIVRYAVEGFHLLEREWKL